MSHTITFYIFDEFQFLDLAGPLTAFEMATRYTSPSAYELKVVALRGGKVSSSSGVMVHATEMDPGADTDTLVIVGGAGSVKSANSIGQLKSIRTQVNHARRICSICTGAYILGASGLLDGCRATTHWNWCDDFAKTFPRVRVEPGKIYVRDGNIWTSAGVTAGIDLALALIEDDLGSTTAQWVAQQLVVYYPRTGGQPQLSSLLRVPQSAGRFKGLLSWIRENIGQPLQVEQLAQQANMSPRHFARAFLQELGTTPAKMVERIRLDMAQERIEAGRETMDKIAEYAGFGDPERMRRAFLRAYGEPPQARRRVTRDHKNKGYPYTR